MVTAAICTIGDEILIGQVLDTNSRMIARELGSVGVKISSMISIGDARSTILDTIGNLMGTNDLVIITGGLGPTKDDITKAALACLTGSKGYYNHEGQAAKVREILQARGLDILDSNKAQSLVPDTCEVIVNQRGTAPIMVFRPTSESRQSNTASVPAHKATIYAMPGVPFETQAALPDVLEDIKAHYSTESIFHKNIMTYGMAESALSELIASWEDNLPADMHLAYLPNPLTGVRLRISVYGGSIEDASFRTETEIAKLRPILGDIIYSECDDTLEHALGRILANKGATVSCAESCTGGEIAHLFTSVPGSSAYFLGSVTSYAISVKEKVLGVPEETIRQNGVVSAQVAAAMAEGVRQLTGSTYSVSTTGLAGPGGDDQNPEGTVWIGVASPMETITEKFVFHNDRTRNIERFAATALYQLWKVVNRD